MLNNATTDQVGSAMHHAQDAARYLAIVWGLELRLKEPEHWRESAEKSIRDLAAALGYELVPMASTRVTVLSEKEFDAFTSNVSRPGKENGTLAALIARGRAIEGGA